MTTFFTTKIKRWLRLYGIGFTMGTVDLVPGVSGGTVAFVSGIYEELLFAIKTLSGETLGLLIQRKWRDAWRSIPFEFLLPLLAGIISAVFLLAGFLSHLLKTQAGLVWALFFGLVAASTWVVARRITKWNLSNVAAFSVAAVATFLLLGIPGTTLPHTLPALFVGGAIAICAMILPGISGSFILVLLGQYAYLLESVIMRRFSVLVVFSLGAAVGLALFSRVLTWLFQKHHNLSVAILSGIMLGSLRKIWPFWYEGGYYFGDIKVWALVVVGIVLVLVLARQNALKERVSDISSPEFRKEHAEALNKTT